MASKFVIDFAGEEDYVERAPARGAEHGTYRRQYRKVAFTFPDMVEFLTTGRVGRMRVGIFRNYQTVPSVRRGHNDALVLYYDLDHHPARPKVDYRLFDNIIATLDLPDNNGPFYLALRDAGWKTQTTKDRIDTLLDSSGILYRIVSHRGTWYVAPNDQEHPERTWDRNEWLPWGDGKTFAVDLR